MPRVFVSGAPTAAWLAALALSRHGIGGVLSTAPAPPGEVSLEPFVIGCLRRWGVLDDDAPSRVAERDLLHETRRRVAGFGLFTEGVEADAALSIHAGDDGPGMCIGADVNTAVKNLAASIWRVSGRIRGWYAGPLCRIGQESLDDPRLAAHFDVKLVLLADAALAKPWGAALERFAHHIPLDLVTVGPGGRLPEVSAISAAGGVLVAPGGEILASWPRLPEDPGAALARALIAAGVRPGVLR